MRYYVYIHTNKINGKRYIGVTRNDPEKRWCKGKAYHHNKHFTSAIQKYGWENFEHFILEVGSPELMYKLEQQYIDYYQTTNPDKGYNKSSGGESGGYRGKNSGTREYKRDYYIHNKNRLAEVMKVYRDSHKDKQREYNRYYRIENSYKMKEYQRKYYLEHKKKIEDIEPINTLW